DYVPDAVSVYEKRMKVVGIPTRMTFEIFSFIECLHEMGLAPLDFSPQNVLVDKSGKLWFIDFELLHRYDRPLHLRENYVFTGYPFGSEVDGLYRGKLGYNNIWYPVTGVRLESLLSFKRSQAFLDRCEFSLF